jgi:hypothetical protein
MKRSMETSPLERSFATVLWTAIVGIDIVIAVARLFLPPGPVRLSMALTIPALILLGALINAIYNRITTGHALEAPPQEPAARH